MSKIDSALPRSGQARGKGLARTIVRLAAGVPVLLLMLAPAKADAIRTTHCMFGYGSASCITTWRGRILNPHVVSVPGPRNETETAEAAARERLWFLRCNPTVWQDQYGVARYHYSAPGCDLGKSE